MVNWHIKKAKDRVGEGKNVVSGVAQETQDVVDCAPDTIMTIKKGD